MNNFWSQLVFISATIGLMSVLAPTVSATSTGRFGAYQNGCGGGGCHNQGAAATLALSGPRTVDAGTTADYTFTIAHATNDYGGFNVSFRTAQGGAAGTLTAGNGSQLGTGELTHTGAKQAAGGTVSFPFQWTAPAQHGTYTFYGAGNAVNNNNASSGDVYNTTGAITISVPGASLTSPNASASFCVGSSVTINWTQTSITNVRIELSANDFANITVINNSIAASAGTYTYSIPTNTAPASTYAIRLVNAASGVELSRVSPLTISGAPTIVEQPASQEVCEGRSFQLRCGASGSGLTYQWRKGGTPIPGGTTSVLNIVGPTTLDAGVYDCVVSGCAQTATSGQATIAITLKPTIATQPVSKTICEGDSVSFFVAASGTTITYQWLLNGVPIANATNATYKIPSSVPASEGTYRCRVSGACTPQALSDTAQLVVLEHVAISGQPTDKTLTAGDTLKLSVASFGEALSYQWLHNGAPISGATSKDYVKNGVVRADSGKYRCVVKNQCDTVASRDAIVKVNSAPGPGILGLSVSSLEVGEILLCDDRDTTIAVLLVNEGGSSITVTSATTDPAAIISLVGFTAPLTIPTNGFAPVSFTIKPSALGAITGSVTFMSSGGNKTLTVNGTTTNAVDMDKDTMTFASATGEVICMASAPLGCPELIVQSITFSGPNASSFALKPVPTLPMAISQGQTFDVCVEVLDNNAGTAIVTIATTGGSATTTLIRVPVSSVDEENAAFPGLTVAPNPANEFVHISAPSSTDLRVRVMSITGQTIGTLQGTNSIRWLLSDTSGKRVTPGLYVLLIEDGNKSTLSKVFVY